MCEIYTAGYEGRTVDEFIELMQDNHIDLVLDVREIPISRKKGFSKSSLSALLRSSGINYVHIRELGSPKDIREQLYKTKDYEEFFAEYRIYIGQHFKYVQQAWEYAVTETTCLLCFEKNPEQCHRSVIADLIQTTMPSVDGVVNL